MNKKTKKQVLSIVGGVVAIVAALVAVPGIVLNINIGNVNNHYATNPGTGEVIEHVPETSEDEMGENPEEIVEGTHMTADWTSDQLRGPMDRPTFTLQNPAPYITFNSMLGAPAVLNGTGDERDFVLLATDRNDISTITERVVVENGQEVYVLAFVHNNARADLNLIARNVTASFEIPETSILSGGMHILPVFGHISATNANPVNVWDSARFVAAQPFTVEYVPDTAQFAQVGGIITELENPTAVGGVSLGDIPGCTEYQGWVTFLVRVEFLE